MKMQGADPAEVKNARPPRPRKDEAITKRAKFTLQLQYNSR